MILTIISPTQEKTETITWLEINTPQGNFVIQPGHAPMLITLAPDKKFIYESSDGKKNSLPASGGLAHIKRDSITIILNQ